MKLVAKGKKEFDECYEDIQKAMEGLQDIFDINSDILDLFHKVAYQNLQAIDEHLHIIIENNEKHKEVHKYLQNQEFRDILKTYPRIYPH